MTTGARATPYRAHSTFAGKDGLVLLDQIRALDRRRLVRRLGIVEEMKLREVLSVLQEMFAH
jgi:mRNA interferase MazF